MKKIAIVYDWMDKWGGVERLLLVLHKMYPEAEFYTSFYDKEKATWAQDISVKTSFMQRLPQFVKSSRILSLPFFPYAFESFNFRNYDVVLSVTSAFAKSIVTGPETIHISIVLTPPRYLWSHVEKYFSSVFVKALAAPYLAQLRSYDYVTARRPDKVISISNLVADRCKKYYGLESEVIYPPFDENHWKTVKKSLPQDTNLPNTYYLVVSRLEPYKNVESAIQACNELKANLIVVGSGSRKKRLMGHAGPTVSFRENLTDVQLGTLYSRAQALLMPQEEDFGYTALEAQYFGCPVISYARSGAAETIIEGVTGITFPQPTAASLKDAIEQFTPIAYNMRRKIAAKGSKHLAAFSVSRFKSQLSRYLYDK